MYFGRNFVSRLFFLFQYNYDFSKERAVTSRWEKQAVWVSQMNGSSCCVMQPIPISQSMVTTPAAAITNYMRLTITALEENLRYKNIPSYVSLSFLNELSNIIYSVNFTLLPFSSSFCHVILLQAVFLVKFPRPCYVLSRETCYVRKTFPQNWDTLRQCLKDAFGVHWTVEQNEWNWNKLRHEKVNPRS